jgi:hypothetical protein
MSYKYVKCYNCDKIVSLDNMTKCRSFIKCTAIYCEECGDAEVKLYGEYNCFGDRYCENCSKCVKIAKDKLEKENIEEEERKEERKRLIAKIELEAEERRKLREEEQNKYEANYKILTGLSCDKLDGEYKDFLTDKLSKINSDIYSLQHQKELIEIVLKKENANYLRSSG